MLIPLNYYNLIVWAREEARAKGPVIVLSIRDQSGHIIYEHPPRVIPELIQYLATPDPKADDILTTIPTHYMTDLLTGYLGLSDKAAKDERDQTVRLIRDSNLSLAVLLAAFNDILLSMDSSRGGKRKKASIEDDRRAVLTLLQHEGTTPWLEVNVQKCAPWLADLSNSLRKGCIRIMRKLIFELEKKGVTHDYMGWDSYKPPDIRTHSPSPKSLIKKNNLPTTLTHDQLKSLIYGDCDPNKVSGASMSGIDIAIILMSTLGLTPEEICGLNLENFTELLDYKDRSVINITKTYKRKEGKKNCQLVPIKNQHQRRRLPLPHHIVETILTPYVNSRVKSPDGSTPLVTSKASNKRRMTPNDLEKEIELRLHKLYQAANIDYLADYRPKYDVLINTATRALSKAGCEEEEIDYIMGKKSKSTWAVHYNDFGSEYEQNKIGSIQDKVINRMIPTAKTANIPTTNNDKKLSKKGQAISWCAGGQACTKLNCTIDLHNLKPDSIPEDGITLELAAPYGLLSHIKLLKE